MLDEAGVAQELQSGFKTVTVDTSIIIDTKTINCPTGGYVLAVYSAEFNFFHVNGASSIYTIWLSLNGKAFTGSIRKVVEFHSGMPHGANRMIVSLNYIFTVDSGNQTINLVADRATGHPNYTFDDRVLSLVFIPTAYGTLSKSGASTDLLEIDLEGEVIE